MSEERVPDLVDGDRYTSNEIAQRMWQTFNATGDRWFKYAAQRLERDHTAREQLVKAREALRPLAEMKLWTDSYPDAKFDDAFGGITVDMVKSARAALTDEKGQP